MRLSSNISGDSKTEHPNYLDCELLTIHSRKYDESALVAAVRMGQAKAFDTLCALHGRLLFRSAIRVTRNHQDAEDAVQNALLSAFVHIGRFDGRSTLSTWLTRIAINSALGILRKKRSSRETDSVTYDDLCGTNAERELTDLSPSPEQNCVYREHEEILQKAICNLRPSIRKVIELQQLGEYSVSETAGLLGVSISATKSRLLRGRVALQKSFRAKTRGRTVAK